MVDDADQNAEPEWLRTMPLRSEDVGFTREELTLCASCGRSNAPNRPRCLYCGTELEGRIEITAAEDWENGYNVVVVDTHGVADADTAAGKFASIVRGDKEFVRAAIESGKRIPIMRVGSEEQAVAVGEKLGELGIRTTTIDDDSLKALSPPVRLRSIGFEADRLNLGLFNLDEFYPIVADKLVLIVAGTIFEGRNESVEKRKLRGSKTLDETTTLSDEPLIDIYSIDDPIGWRIPARGFDFSCLGTEKSLVVAENMKRLITKFREFAPRARLVDDYASVRSLIEITWPSEVKRQGQLFDRKKVSTVFTTNNGMQFTKYSRMQWQLLYEEKV